ncbi:MAG: hypothetical protein ACRDL0_04645 [Thermoleophilaceae bacterium]
MRKVVAPTAGLLALGVLLVAPSVAQTPATEITVKTKVSPNKAGTKKKPRGVTLSGTVTWDSEEGFEPPIITGARVLFPKGSLYNGRKYPKCSVAQLNRNGLGGCPRKSIMGKARAVAFADTEITRPKVTIVNGGARRVCLYTVMNNPARVRACVPGKIKKLRSRKWKYQLTLRVPEVLQVVAGIPIALRKFTYKAGGKRWAKDWLATTSCPRNRRWPYQVETFYLYNDGTTESSTYADSIRCRR